MIDYKEQLTQFFKFNYRTKTDSQRPVPELENPTQLRDPKIVAQFEALVYEVVHADEGEIAFLGRRLIEDLLLPQDPQMRQVASPIFQRYQRLIQILKFVNLSTYAMSEILELVRTRLGDVVSLGCPVVNRFQRVADAYDTVNPAGTVPQNLINAVMACEQRLGSRSITVSGKPVAPTIGNWIKDFVAFSANSAEGNSGSLQRVRYLESTANAKSLSNDEEATLLRIFRLYNWLLLGDESYEDFSEEFISNLQQSQVQPNRPSPVPNITSNVGNIVPINKIVGKPTSIPLRDIPKAAFSMDVPKTLGATGAGVNVQNVLYRENNSAKPGGLDLENTDAESRIANHESRATKTSPIPVPKPAIENRDKRLEISGLDKQAIPSAEKGGFPVLKPKTIEESLNLKEKIGYPAKEDKGKDIDEKLAKLKARTGKSSKY